MSLTNEHVCRYLELNTDGSYYCGGCQKSYRLTQVEPPADLPIAQMVVPPYQGLSMLTGSVGVSNGSPHLIEVIARRVPSNRQPEPTPECASCKDWLAMGKLYCGDCGRQIPQWATTENRT